MSEQQKNAAEAAFFALQMKRAVRAHFEGVAAQSNAECGIRNSEFRTEAMECVLGSPVLTERD